MKKITLIVVAFLMTNFCFSQKMMTRNGEVKFEGTMPGIEEIAGTNKTSSCIFDNITGDFVSLVLVKGFKFKSPLMEEHFNENYMESTKFPKATFKGKVLNFDNKKPVGVYDLEGDLTIHGVTKKVKVKITFTTNGNKLVATSNFSVKPQDYNIEIPKLVKNKIADNIKITLNFTLEIKE